MRGSSPCQQLPVRRARQKDSGQDFYFSAAPCIVYCYCYILHNLFSIAPLLPEFRLAESRKAHPGDTADTVLLLLLRRPLSQSAGVQGSTRPVLKRTRVRFMAYDDEEG